MEYLWLIPINLKKRELRSWLTLLGVVIGVMAIILLVSLGDGLKGTVTKELENFGAQNVVIMPGSISMFELNQFSPTQGKLYLNDVDRIKKVPGVEFTSKVLVAPSRQIKFKDDEVTLGLKGFESELFYSGVFPQFKVQKGRFYKDTESKVAVVGYGFANNLFDKKIEVGSNIYINDDKYKVVGILEKVGTSLSMESADNIIFVPYNEVRRIADDSKLIGKNEIFAIYLKISDGFEISEVTERIAFELRSAHKVKEDDFTLISSEFFIKQIDSILSILTIFLGTIASISLLVSAVGVSNTMFTAILERTREIGIMKSLGAKDKNILIMFLTESALICGIGGIIGILLSFMLILLVNYLSIAFDLGIEAVLTPWLAVGAFMFSLLIGIIAGFIPAWNASKLDPVAALRFK